MAGVASVSGVVGVVATSVGALSPLAGGLHLSPPLTWARPVKGGLLGQNGCTHWLKTLATRTERGGKTPEREQTGTWVQTGKQEIRQPYTTRCAVSYSFLSNFFFYYLRCFTLLFRVASQRYPQEAYLNWECGKRLLPPPGHLRRRCRLSSAPPPPPPSLWSPAGRHSRSPPPLPGLHYL